MGFVLKVSEDGDPKELFFKTKDDATRFKAFVNTYMEESGAGNGYSAYWVMFDAKIAKVSKIFKSLRDLCTELNYSLLTNMLHSILQARTAGSYTKDDFNRYELPLQQLPESRKKSGIIFNLSDLPPRQRPTTGDMFRTLYSQGALVELEGRVIEDNGDTFQVIRCFDEGKDGKPKKNAKVITIPATQVMKINDWQQALKNR